MRGTERRALRTALLIPGCLVVMVCGVIRAIARGVLDLVFGVEEEFEFEGSTTPMHIEDPR